MIRVREIGGHFVVDNDPEAEAEFRKGQAEGDAMFRHFQDQAQKRWEEHCAITERKWQDALSPPPPPRYESAPLEPQAAPPLPEPAAPLPVPAPPIVAPCPADHAAEPAASMPAWSVNKNERFTGYNVPLHAVLSVAHREGRPCPKAHDVLEAWRICLPPEIAKVLPDGFDCYNNAGNTKHVGIAALREAIRRMTKTR